MALIEQEQQLISSAASNLMPTNTTYQLQVSNKRPRQKRDHQAQYDDPVADFFSIFNRRTGRDTLFAGHLQGHLGSKPSLSKKNAIYVDFGCGTGWLTRELSPRFANVFGIDTSEAKLKIAREEQATRINSNTSERFIAYHQQPPADIFGKCNFISAVHVHYHFDSEEKLREQFFRVAAKMLAPKGEFVVIGCPSEHIAHSPEHYTNSISLEDIPEDSRKKVLQFADSEGFVPLSKIAKFKIKDGTQMKVLFKTMDDRGSSRRITLTDTYWSDQALIRSAKAAGLRCYKRNNLTWRGHPNAYATFHFKKITPPKP